MSKKREMKRRGNRRNRGGGGAFQHPPPLKNAQLTYSVRRRFVATTAQAGATFSSDILLDGICVATAAATASQLFQAVKIRGVHCWAVNQTAANVPTTVSVEFSSTRYEPGDQYVHTSTAVGIVPAVVHAVPSSKCLASFFTPSSQPQVGARDNFIMFSLTCPVGTIIDVDAEFIGSAGVAEQAVSGAVAGLTLGVQYFRGLDGLAPGATQLPAQLPASFLA